MAWGWDEAAEEKGVRGRPLLTKPDKATDSIARFIKLLQGVRLGQQLYLVDIDLVVPIYGLF